MNKSILFTEDNREELMATVKEWFHNDKRVSFRLDERVELVDDKTYIQNVLVIIVPAFSDGELYTFHTVKPGDTITVTREDIWPVLVVAHEHK